jgi:hypothetical protein
VLAALCAVLLLPAAALAEQPFRLASPLEDPAGVLTSEQRGAVEAAQADLQTTHQVQLWVVYVNTFSGLGAQDWAEQTAITSDLGLNDALLAVAVEDRAYAYSVDQNFPLTTDQLNTVMLTDVEPKLSQDDWAGAAIGAADGISAAMGGGTSSKPGGGVSTVTLVAIAIPAILVIAGVVILLGRRKKERGGTAGPAQGRPAAKPQASVEELRKQANLQLVDTDDAIKTSEEELGFAVAEFGDEAAAPFRQALDAARQELAAAFKLRTQLEDTKDEAAQRTLLNGILQHTRTANDKLDAEAERFDKLRDLEGNLPQMLAGLEQRIGDLAARLPQAAQTLKELAGVYAQSALAVVADNAEEAQARLDFARTQVTDSREDLAAGRKGEAVVTAVAAEEAAGQAQQLLDAVERLRQDLASAAQRIAEAIAETQRDIAEAQAIGDQAQFGALIDTARTACAAAQAAAAPEGGRDPLGALLRLHEADDALEKALQPVRDAREQWAKAAASLERTLMAAQSQVASANDYITTHRGAIGSGPRTRLAEAQQNLSQAAALGQSDPVRAAQYAAQAQQLAGAAISQAQSEVYAAQSAAAGPSLAPGGGMGNMAGAIIGGILINSMLGGGGHSSFGGGGGGGRRGGGFSVGSFGGGGMRGRRGGGGRF